MNIKDTHLAFLNKTFTPSVINNYTDYSLCDKQLYRGYVHMKIHTPPVVHFSKSSTGGASILNGVAHSCKGIQVVSNPKLARLYVRLSHSKTPITSFIYYLLSMVPRIVQLILSFKSPRVRLDLPFIMFIIQSSKIILTNLSFRHLV